MRKEILLVWLNMALGAGMMAQNLVPNGSFEEFANCPYTLSEIAQATHWSTYRGTCDYFNACDLDTMSVPSNWFGYQYAATGSAYAGIYCFSEDDGNPLQAREWLGTELIASLVPGTQYYVSFKACLTTGGYGTNGSFIYAADHLGVLLTNSEFLQTHLDPVPNHADVFGTSIITDSTDWATVAGYFVADSAYSHIVVGNFFDDATTNAVQVVPDGLYQLAYYYIDDVCLSPNPADCIFPMQVIDRDSDRHVRVASPFNDELRITLPSVPTGRLKARLTDMAGRQVWRTETGSTAQPVFHIPAMPDGLYVLQLSDESGDYLPIRVARQGP